MKRSHSSVESTIPTLEEVLKALKEDNFQIIKLESGGVQIWVYGVFRMVFKAIENFDLEPCLEGKALKNEIIELAQAGFQDLKVLSVGHQDMSNDSSDMLHNLSAGLSNMQLDLSFGPRNTLRYRRKQDVSIGPSTPQDLSSGPFSMQFDASVSPSNMMQYLARVDWVLDTKTSVVFPELEYLTLRGLPNLEGICYGQLPLGSFKQLRRIKLSHNNKLGYLFSPAIANGLSHIEELNISDCDIMTAVFKETAEYGKSETNKIELPNLNDLQLTGLRCLTSLCEGIDEISFPQLKKLHLQPLPELRSILAPKGNHITSSQSLFNHKVAFPSLEVLELDGLAEVASLANLEVMEQDQLGAGFWCKLRKMTVRSLPKIKDIFSASIAKVLVNLEELKIESCQKLEEIIALDFGGGDSKEPGEVIILPKLQSLYLYGLQNLASFCHQPYTFHGPFMETLFDVNIPTKYILFNKQVAFPSLEVLELDGLAEVAGLANLEGMEQDQLGAGFWCKLRKMTVRSLPKIKDIFLASIAKVLVNLEELKIESCQKLEEIIALDFGGGDSKEPGEVIILPKLLSLYLYGLQNLASFCHQPYTFHGPFMETLGDVNIPMKYILFNKQVAFPSLEVLELDGLAEVAGLANLEGMEQDQLGAGFWCKLRKMTVRSLPKIKDIFSASVAKVLVNLEELNIDRCRKLEEIIALDFGGGDSKEPGEVAFPRLTVLTIGSCDILRNLFSASMIGNFIHLESLKIENCSMMEEIIAEEEQEEESLDTDLFPQLKILVLRNLPRLTSFCHMKYDSEFPLLNELVVHGCLKMKILSPGFPSRLDVENDWNWSVDTLNCIQGHRSGEKVSPRNPLYTTIKERGREGVKIAQGAAMVALQGFITIDWNYYKVLFNENGIAAFESFKVSVFKAIAKFVLLVYDLEDFEHAVDIDKISNECETFRKLCTECHEQSGYDPLTAISERILDLERLPMIREQDMCNILKWYESEYTDPHEMDELNNIGSFAVEPCGLSFPCIIKAFECIEQYIDFKEEAKMHLRMELKDCNCFCTLDACYMESWREINNIKKLFSEWDEKIEDLVSDIHNVIYESAAIKIAGLCKCHRMVVYPLTSKVFGKWKEEAIEVVRCAEIERRSQGCRFIGVNHLLSCLLPRYIPEISVKKLQHLEPNVDIPGEPTKYPIYYIYKSSHNIATTLDHREIGVEHLYLAIVLEQNGINKHEWTDRLKEKDVKDFIESVQNKEGSSSGDKGEDNSRAINIWSRFNKDFGEKRHIEGSVLPLVQSIQRELESEFLPLKLVDGN